MTSRLFVMLTLIFGLSLLLSACGANSLPAPQEPSPDSIATQVSFLLTASPVFTPIAPVIITNTPEPPTPEPIMDTPTPTLSVPTDTPAITPTLLPTATTFPLLTSTPSTADPRTLLGNPTWQDKTFRVNQNWGNAWDDDDFTRGEFKDNKLVLTSVGMDGWTLTWPKPENFYIEMTATPSQCSGRDRYGLIVRVPEGNDRGYLFGFTCDGQYSLRRWDPEAKQYDILVNWTATPHINAGPNQTNRLGLRAEGSRFQLYANGHYLNESSDSTLKDGRFGPFVGHDKTENFSIAISEISYWDLP
jgi:hypothetical protein